MSALAVVAVAGLAYGAAFRSARPAAERGLAELDRGLAATRAGDDVAAADHLGRPTRPAADGDHGGWLPPPPGCCRVGHNARATEVMAASAADASQAGAVAAADADTDSLTVQDGALDLAQVRTLEVPLAMSPARWARRRNDSTTCARRGCWTRCVDRARPGASRGRRRTPRRRPGRRRGPPRPALFGGDEPSRWFVAFVTPVEARGRTGFLGQLRGADRDGRAGRDDAVRTASELEAGGTPGAQRTLSGPADYLQRWSRFAPATTWRNVTMSPDFPSVGQVVAELYPQSSGQPVDG